MSPEVCDSHIEKYVSARCAEPLPCKCGWEALHLRQNNCSRQYTSFPEILICSIRKI